MRFSTIFILSCLLLISITSSAQRDTQDFTQDWKFHLGHTWDITKDFGYGSGINLQFAKLEPAPYGGHGIPSTLLNFDDSEWANIEIPHDWSVDLPYDFSQDKFIGNRYGYKVVGREYPETSIGWYRKKFNINKDDEGKRIVVEFDGVFRDCMVWVNGFFMGRQWSGYSGFNMDVSDYLIYGKENVISVRVDASLHEGWFYEGSGINKEVSLIITDPLHVVDVGPYVTTVMSDEKATVTVSTKVLNEGFSDKKIQLINEIIDANGNIIVKHISDLQHISQRNENTIQQTIMVPNPQLWSVELPQRYTLKTKVISEDKVVDTYETKFGIRSVEFNADRGFLLNGKRVQIQGVCIHQNFAGVGSALPEALHYYRLKLLKEMGVNAIRSHYPFSKSMLNACDSLGMLVMDETRAAGSSTEALGQVKWMVTNHRNHPSIIIWSMANEEGGTQRDIIGRRYMKKMVAEAHKYDSTRMVTAGVNAWGGKVDFGFSQEIDVMGFNYSTEFIDEYHKNHPTQPLMGTEVSNATVTRGVYEFSNKEKSIVVSDGVGGYYMPEGEAEKAQVKGHITANNVGTNQGAYNVFKFYAEREYLSGSFFWTGFDYNGETWPSTGPNNSSQFGAMDIAGFPKPMYYYYKSWWTNEPVLHIAQHWNWPGLEGKEIEVLIHSNCDKIELIHNEKSLGKRDMPKYGHIAWNVKYSEGKLKAVGYKQGKKILEEEIITAGKPSRFKLEAHTEVLQNSESELIIVNVEVQDKKGNLAPLASNQVDFVVEGDAQILGVGNGNPTSAEIDSNTSRKAFNGKCMVILRKKKASGPVKLIVKSEQLKSTSIKL